MSKISMTFGSRLAGRLGRPSSFRQLPVIALMRGGRAAVICKRWMLIRIFSPRWIFCGLRCQKVAYILNKWGKCHRHLGIRACLRESALRHQHGPKLRRQNSAEVPLSPASMRVLLEK
jgi:hypothetical protein